jgi:hypothetical protein
MPFQLATFAFWSGVYNAGLALVLLFPAAYPMFGLNICSPVWAWLISGFLGFTSAVLILSSRDLPARASFVYWEALLRYVAALVLSPAHPQWKNKPTFDAVLKGDLAGAAAIRSAILGLVVATPSLTGKCVTGRRLDISGF